MGAACCGEMWCGKLCRGGEGSVCGGEHSAVGGGGNTVQCVWGGDTVQWRGGNHSAVGCYIPLPVQVLVGVVIADVLLQPPHTPHLLQPPTSPVQVLVCVVIADELLPPEVQRPAHGRVC